MGGIGKFKCAALDVTNLTVAEQFWSAVTGYPVFPSPFPGRYSYVGHPDPWDCELILHLVDTEKGDEANRAHIDFWVGDLDVAIEQVVALGGTLHFGPILHPRPGAYPAELPQIDWAVMRDPFGNEFCLTTVLTREQSEAAAALPPERWSDTEVLRVAAGVTAGR
jgi:predicted enzyme related to lactoylglutathione lyase